MRATLPAGIVILTGVAALMVPVPTSAQVKPDPVTTIEIPESIRHEHHEIHATLVEATKAPGGVGAAAKALAAVLDPHFKREEEIALPPLGLLAPLSRGAAVSGGLAPEVLKMTDALRRELPGMLAEHKKIREAVDGLRKAAVAEKAVKYQALADQLAHHAQTEEEVLYPTAILVGEVIRARQPGK